MSEQGFSKMSQEQEVEDIEKQPQQQLEIQPLRASFQKYRSFSFIFLAVSNISLSAFYFGYTIVYLSVIDFGVVMNIFNINTDRSTAEGFLTFCVPLGGLIGAYCSSYFIRSFSRRTTLLYVNVLAFVLGCLLFFCSFGGYVFVRIGQGMCAGCFSSVVPLIIKQLVPVQLSGIFGVFQQLFITIGIFFCCFLTFILSLINEDETGQTFWKIVFSVPLFSISLQLILLSTIFKFETPKYLVQIGNLEEAKNLISCIYKDEYVDQVLSEFKQEVQRHKNISDNMGENQGKVQLKLPKKVAIHLAILQQFVGISAVATYARAIAEGSLSSLKPMLPSILNFQQVVSAVFSSFLLTKHGRKTILQVGTAGAAVSNLVIAVGYWIGDSSPSLSLALILPALFYYMANFGLSLGPIVWMYIPQVVPASFVPFSTMVNWGGSALTILLFPIIKAHLPNQNPALLFFFFSVWSCFAFLFNRRYVVETKDKTQLQIEEEYHALQNKTNKEQ